MRTGVRSSGEIWFFNVAHFLGLSSCRQKCVETSKILSIPNKNLTSLGINNAKIHWHSSCRFQNFWSGLPHEINCLDTSLIQSKPDVNGVKENNGRVHPINFCSWSSKISHDFLTSLFTFSYKLTTQCLLLKIEE